MNYSPKGMYVWDAWCMPLGDQVHCYHLQRARPSNDELIPIAEHLGHAVSSDLINWQERPTCFGPDSSNPIDDGQPWTGCALWHQDQGYLFYTMRGVADGARVQRIGLATSTDPDNWIRYQHNPIIEPDTRWYADVHRPVPGIVDCRDLVIVDDPKGTGWIGFYATRVLGEELPETSAIACAKSEDLIHWKQQPPAFAPRSYSCLEVPDVFELNGRWYLTCLVGHWYGNRGIWKDPHLTNGTMYAVADRPEGPYVELDNNCLLAAGTSAPCSCRSVVFNGQRYILYTDRERTGRIDTGEYNSGTLSTPKLLATDGDKLYAQYSPLIESRVVEELIGASSIPTLSVYPPQAQIWPIETGRWTQHDPITGESRTGWSIACLQQKAESYIFEATVVLEKGVACGLTLRMADGFTGAVVALDAKAGTVFYGEIPAFEFMESRNWPVQNGRSYHLKVVNRIEHVEVYIDDRLATAFSRYKGIGGEVGLFVDRGTAHFSDIRMRKLQIDTPS